MSQLIIIEMNKFIRKKKNIITIAMFAVLIGLYIFANLSLDNMITQSRLNSYKEELKSAQDSLNTLKAQYKDEKQNSNRLNKLIDETENKVGLLKEREVAANNSDWKKELEIQLKLDSQLIDDIQSGSVVSGENLIDVKKRIMKNQMLYDKNIQPINEDQSMTSYNFIRLASRDLLPILAIIIVLLLSSDIVSSESDEGTFKFLLVQPIPRYKILLAKIIAVSLLCLLSIFSIMLIFFIILGFIKGFGSPMYPTEYYTGSFSSFFYHANGNYTLQFIGIRKFILISLPLNILLIIFVTSMGMLLSTLIQNSTAAICTSIITFISFNIISTQLKLLSKISQFIPLTYCNLVKVLDGSFINELNNKNVTYLTAVIVFMIFTIGFNFISVIVFRKKDIVC